MSKPIQVHDETLEGRQVRWIELTRISRSNALSTELLDQAAAAVTEAPERVILISSRGRTFSAGLDLKEMLKRGSAAEQLRALIRLYDALVRHPSATACLVEQKAVAGGVGLALCADAVVMGCNAWFTLPAESVYRPLAAVLFPVVRARCGISRVEFDRWYGRRIGAAELAADGHIHRVVHQDPQHAITAELKRVAVEVLEEKSLYRLSNLGDRISEDARADQRELAERAIKTSGTGSFLKSVERHLAHSDQDPRAVFVVHGRNEAVRRAMFQFLRALDLKPLEWSTMVQATGETAPYVGTVLETGFAIAQAVVVLMTGDDLAQLRETLRLRGDASHEREPTPQARPNVLIEAGMALGIDPTRTIIVEFGDLRPASDLLGRMAIRMEDSPEVRSELVERLAAAGCALDRTGTDWYSAGDFRGA